MDELYGLGTVMPTPSEILEAAMQQAEANRAAPQVEIARIVEDVKYICELSQNRSGPRFMMACLLAKTYKPEIDIRKPYKTSRKASDTEDSLGSYGGRNYDEKYVANFVIKYQLPCNSTTAFLTPAYRTKGNLVLTPGIEITGRPVELYTTLVRLLDDVFQNRVMPKNLLAEVIRRLLILRDENQQRIEMLLEGLRASARDIPLSAEAITQLIQGHLSFARASRLPVLEVTSAYRTASNHQG
jgi:hypothetical protein